MSKTMKMLSMGLLTSMIVVVSFWIMYIVKGLQQKELNVTVYASCPCSICNTIKWEGKATKGKFIKEFTDNHINICATDNSIIPYDSKVIYNGVEYIVKDVGSKIKGNKICILLNNHRETILFGIKKNQKVFVVE